MHPVVRALYAKLALIDEEFERREPTAGADLGPAFYRVRRRAVRDCIDIVAGMLGDRPDEPEA